MDAERYWGRRTGRVQLVIASSPLMMFSALPVMVLGRYLLACIFMLLLLHNFIEIGLSDYLLESPIIVGAATLAARGWLMHVRSAGRVA